MNEYDIQDINVTIGSDTKVGKRLGMTVNYNLGMTKMDVPYWVLRS